MRRIGDSTVARKDFPYPIQYFSCKDYDKDPLQTKLELMYLTKLDLDHTGAIVGETGLPGLFMDFNNGLRIQLPKGAWHVTIRDGDSGITVYDQDISEQILVSWEKYHIRWQVDIYLEGSLVFSHEFDPAGQKVRIVLTTRLLGDTLATLPYVPLFQQYYQASVSYWTPMEWLQELCRHLLPDIPQEREQGEETYATFYINPAFYLPSISPFDGRMVPMTDWGKIILKLYEPAPPLQWPAGPRQIKEPYVCISVQASSVVKGWLYPNGWDEVVAFLKGQGYRVLCIDKASHQEDAGLGIAIDCPRGAEDFTGDRSIIERGNMLSHADFFIGLGSGLSWLAHTVGCPVVMICGFSMYWSEFPTPYRVYNPLACSACYNDVHVFWHKTICPYHKKDSPEFLSCQRKISPKMVIQAIQRLQTDLSTKKVCTHER